MWEAVTNPGLQGVGERSRRPAEREAGDPLQWLGKVKCHHPGEPATESWQEKGVIQCRLEKVTRNKIFTIAKEEDGGLRGEHQSYHQLPLEDCPLDRNMLHEDQYVG